MLVVIFRAADFEIIEKIYWRLTKLSKYITWSPFFLYPMQCYPSPSLSSKLIITDSFFQGPFFKKSLRLNTRRELTIFISFAYFNTSSSVRALFGSGISRFFQDRSESTLIFSNIYVCAKSLNRPKCQFLQNILEPIDNWNYFLLSDDISWWC